MKNRILILIIIFIIFLGGCELGNTPTSRVEDYLMNYQMLNEDVIGTYVDLSFDTNISDDYKKRYDNLIRKQYRNMNYEVKEEKIDGDNAIVTVQIEVTNYGKSINKNNEPINDEYHKQILDKLEKTKEKTTYTIDFYVKKDDKDKWKVQSLTEEDKQKILGIIAS